MDMQKLILPAMMAMLAGLFGAVIWPTHERSRDNGRFLLESRKEVYFNYRNHLKSHREEARGHAQILEQWCTERECSPAEEMNERMVKGNFNKWEKRVENFTEENKHMGR